MDFQPAEDFPVDDSGYGFDNIGDVLSVSPVLLEKYLAGMIAREEVITKAQDAVTIQQKLQELDLASSTGQDTSGLIDGKM